jgi:NarL family two-component system response regulator LiaR
MSEIRVLVVDDHPIVRSGLSMAIAMDEEMTVVGEAKDGVEAVEKARSLMPDVIVMDLVMPRKDGVEAIADICQENPQARILVLTSYAQDERIIAAIKAGASGYLLKDRLPDEVAQAIRDVYHGETVIHPVIARKLIQEIRSEPKEMTEVSLTPREKEILMWVARGLPNKQIAQEVHISEATVRAHVSSIFSKLNLANRSQVVLYAIQHGWIDREGGDTTNN